MLCGRLTEPAQDMHAAVRVFVHRDPVQPLSITALTGEALRRDVWLLDTARIKVIDLP